MLRRLDCAMALLAMLPAFGCSDPVPPPASVGLKVTVNRSSSCPSVIADDDIGSPPPDSTNPSIGSGKRVYDGESGVAARCSVTGSGPFAVSGQIASAPKALSFVITSATVNPDGTGTASIALSSPSVGTSVATKGTLCTLSVVTTSTGLQVQPGAIWARFTCPSLEDPPGTSCLVFGEFVLENCSK